RTVWLTRRGGPATIADIQQSKPEILAVHPNSVSGFINPVSALLRAGVTVAPGQIRFTHSHSGSLDALSAGETPQIACVWEPTWKARADSGLIPVEVPGLNDIVNPAMVVVGRRDSAGAESLKGLIQAGKVPDFVYDPNYLKQVEALPPRPLEWSAESLNRTDLNDLVLTLRHYNRTHPSPARLAVVLAGGGAKCSYQAGAVRALEEKLSQAREQFGDENLDIQLVVGTSGGAINALSVAMGLSKTEDGFRDLSSAWLDLDQKEIVSPPFLVRLNMWVWFASVLGLAILFFTRRLRMKRGKTLLFTSLVGAVMALLPRLPVKISSWLGASSELQHFWTWISFGIEGAGFVLLIAAALWEGLCRIKERKGERFEPRLSVVRWLTFLVAVLPILQTWTILWHEEVISENRGLETALLRNFGVLVNQESVRRGAADVEAGTIAELSRAVFDRDLLTRDLVITASPLPEPDRDLPAEYYFFASPHGHSDPAFGERGVSLQEHPEILFDAMLGSAAIYPLFPSRRVKGIPKPDESVDLVDGSFAHRSPLEAAVQWGATHVLVVEASTQEQPGRGKFLHNLGSAMTFLYDQAQLTDVRAEGETVLYTLYPSAPHIGLPDFSAPLIQQSLNKGYAEASGAPSQGSQEGGVLHKIQGPPSFWTP
ncbi:MAG: patatin-like phospholipase family protein, partial [Candidatus Eremiobacteraeota bacterium]|nr:patatin-like phospholipase family protein [Candidatus Eremiobacteraeota bacterium]